MKAYNFIILLMLYMRLISCKKQDTLETTKGTEYIQTISTEASTGEEKNLSAEELDRIIEAQINQEDRDAVIKMEHRVRLKSTEEWTKSVDASVGDTLEFSVYYTNVSGVNAENVMLNVSLPDNMEYINGSTSLIKKGLLLGARDNEDSICDKGVNIGDFDVNEDA